MKILTANRFFRKHGKKALVIYLCWTVVKVLILLLIGTKWLG